MVAVAALAAPACAGTGTTPLTATVEQSRAAQVRQGVNVILASSSDAPVRFERIRLDDDRFEPVPATDRRVTVAPRTPRLLVPVPIGAARCTGTLGTPAVVVDDRRVAIDADGRALLDRLVDDACRREALDRQVDVAFSPDDAVAISPVEVEATLRLRRTGGDDTVTVDAIGSNVIFAVTAPTATLGADDSVLEVRVLLNASRCEPHALAESKKTWLFPVWLALGSGTPQHLELEITGRARALLERALLDGCASQG